MANNTLEFSTRDYEMAHGKMPKGRGSWAFCDRAHYNKTNYMDFVFWTPGGLTLAEAKKLATTHFLAQAECSGTIVICS